MESSIRNRTAIITGAAQGIGRAIAESLADAGANIVIVVGIAAAALGAWLTPGDPPLPTSAPVPGSAAMLDLGADEAASWVTHARSRTALLVGGGVAVLVTILGLLLSTPFLLVPAVVVAAAVLASTWFVVTVDRRGLTVRSAIGWPRMPRKPRPSRATFRSSPTSSCGS